MNFKINLAIILVLFSIFIIPVSAVLEVAGIGMPVESSEIKAVTSWDFAKDDSAIVRVIHSIDSPTSINETYYFGDSIITGSYSCTRFILINTCELNLSYNNQTGYYKYQAINVLGFVTISGEKTKIIASVAAVETTNIFGLEAGIVGGVSNVDFATANVSVPELRTLPVTRIVGSSSVPVDITVETLSYPKYDEYGVKIDNAVSGNLLETILSIWATFSTIIFSLFYYFKLIFYDNLILTIGLIEVFILMHAVDSKNVWVWWKNVLDDHAKILNFIITLISKTVEIITSIIDAFKPV